MTDHSKAALIPAEIEIKDLKVEARSTQHEKFIDGGFVLNNTTPFYIPDIYTSLRFVDDEIRQYGPILLTPYESRVMSVHYEVTPYRKGENLHLELAVQNKRGKPVSSMVGRVSIPGDTDWFVESSDMRSLDTSNHVISLVAINNSSSTFSIVPSVTFVKEVLLNSPTQMEHLSPLLLSPGINRLSLPIQCEKCVGPGKYLVRLFLRDSRVTWGNREFNFSYEIPGKDAFVEAIRLDKEGFQRDGDLKLAIDYRTDVRAILQITFFSKDGEKIKEVLKDINTTDKTERLFLSIKSSEELEFSKINVEIISESTILDTYDVYFQEKDKKNRANIILENFSHISFLICIMSALIAGGLYFQRSKKLGGK
ncbi:MAG: hypothetical protein V4697_01405 [Patescibacteria group bacterium]